MPLPILDRQFFGIFPVSTDGVGNYYTFSLSEYALIRFVTEITRIAILVLHIYVEQVVTDVYANLIVGFSIVNF